MKLFDSEGGFIQQWNKTFLLWSVMALTLDPLFLYVPVINGTQKCLDMDRDLAIVLSAIRSFADILYVFHIIIKFRTAYVCRYNHILWSREFTDDPHYVEKCYPRSYFIIDVFVALPLPQLAVLVIIPNLEGATSFSKENLLKYIIISQYVPRVIQTSLFYRKVTKTSGFLIEKVWAGAAFNFFLYVLASYVFGALWYLFAIESALRCWHIACQRHNCHSEYLYCGEGRVGDYGFLNTSCPLLERNDIKDSTSFDFGIFLDAFLTRILETRDFRQKILYCSLWGLQNLSSLGQGLKASTFYEEALFAYFIVIIGLVLYVLLLGNMQNYLQSPSNQSHRMEEIKEKRREAEDAMSRMALPEDLRQQVRRDLQYNLNITRRIDPDFLLRDLSPVLRMDIKRYLCLPLLKRVPTLEQMDGTFLNAICDCVKQVPYAENSYLVREGDPVHAMLFIKCGEVQSTITDSDQIGFFSSSNLMAAVFCGEELFIWALDPKVEQLPFSTRTVKALTNVEAFALEHGELSQVVSQFRHSHSRRLRNTYRFYSQEWRTWAACYIQTAWKTHCKRKHEKMLEENKRLQDALATGSKTSTLSFRASLYASLFSSVLCISSRNRQSQICNAQVSAPKAELMLSIRVY